MSGPGARERATARSAERDEAIAALELDRYIDGLLALRDEAVARRLGAGSAGRRMVTAPGVVGVARPDVGPAFERTATLDGPPVYLTANRLAEGLVRVHPSFRFEERLSRRLAALAAAMGGGERHDEEAGLQRAGRGVGTPEAPEARAPEPPEADAPEARDAGTPEAPEARAPEAPELGAPPARPTRRAERLAPVPIPLRHPLVIGGAITSAAISIAGAAFLAWRRTRPRHPMARAVRLAHGALGATGALGAAGALGATGALADRPPRTDRRPRGRRSTILASLALRAIERRPSAGGTPEAPPKPGLG